MSRRGRSLALLVVLVGPACQLIAGFERLQAGDGGIDAEVTSTGGSRGSGGTRGTGGKSTGGIRSGGDAGAFGDGGDASLGDSSTIGSGGSVASGGQNGSGGAGGSATGGALVMTGGTVNTGGRISTGGRSATGGVTSRGGAQPSTGGAPSCADAAPPSCPTGLAGPALVPVPIPKQCGSYCVDSTEVTNAQYKAFLDAPDASVPAQESYCAWNTDYEPSSAWPPASGRENFPVVRVDWCDAYAFCKWAGKHLCGRIGGGANAVADSDKPSMSEWFNACSKGATQDYPYGSQFSHAACNGLDPADALMLPVAVASMPGCEGGYAGLFDLSGNVMEWEDSCDKYAGETDGCLARGGSFIYYTESINTPLLCSSFIAPGTRMVAARKSTDNDRGFRCCL